jgi:hypothetical protein
MNFSEDIEKRWVIAYSFVRNNSEKDLISNA